MSGLALAIGMQPAIDAALAALRAGSGEQCLSEHAFANLYLFRAAHDYRMLPGRWPCIAGITYDGTRHLLPLFDLAAAPDDALRALLDGHDCFYPLASAAVARLDAGRFDCTQSRDDADYVYRAANFASYPGRALAKKRNLVRQFLAAHTPASVPFHAGLANAAHAVLRGWLACKGKSAGQADEAACSEAIDNAARLRLEGTLHVADGAPIGFVLAQELQPGVAALRFAKGLDSHVGIYPYMFQHFSRHAPRRVDWLNFEQDMGLAGFRRSKLSYQPHALLPKWRVRLRLPPSMAVVRA